MGVVEPAVVAAAAAALGLPVGRWQPLSGATGRTWAAGEHVLRLVDPARIDAEMAATAAAGSVVPVPPVLARVDLPGTAAVLLGRLPGQPAGRLTGVDRRRAARRGRACGQAQLAINALPAPPGVPPAPGLAGDRLLHLDLHPLNVLVVDDDEVSGVLDWANTAAGPAALDRARTDTILRLDPQARRLAGDASWVALVTGWSEAAHLRELPAPALAWACRYMLNDLADRYRPDQLAHVHAALRQAEPPA
ncbi:MAG: hypothetical protein V7637_2701 [Mycobacteriales bacterium]